MFIEKVKIYGINTISCGCPKNNGYGILEKKVQDIRIRKKNIRDIWMEIPYLSPSFEETRYGYFAHWDR